MKKIIALQELLLSSECDIFDCYIKSINCYLHYNFFFLLGEPFFYSFPHTWYSDYENEVIGYAEDFEREFNSEIYLESVRYSHFRNKIYFYVKFKVIKLYLNFNPIF